MHFQKTSQGYVVRLQKGEEIMESLTRFMDDRGIGAGFVLGLGAVTDVALGFFNAETREYTRKEYHEEYELVNLTGNLSYDGGSPRLHAHVVISGQAMATPATPQTRDHASASRRANPLRKNAANVATHITTTTISAAT